MEKERHDINYSKWVLVFITIFMGMVLAGCSNQNSDSSGTLDNISLLRAANTYSIIDGKFTISYGTDNSIEVPMEVNTDDQATYFEDKAVYISQAVTAIAYEGAGEEPVKVLLSNDEGQSWNNYEVTGTKSSEVEGKYIGFTTANDGWLVLTGGVAMGHQENRIFQTSDGGKTWEEIGNTNQVHARVVTGAGFADDKIGFVSFRYDSDPNPEVYRTDDQGKTWTKCTLAVPESFKSITSYATALSPVFNGASGVLPVVLRNNDWEGDPADVTVEYQTSDYGKTWTFNEEYNLGLIWADAWKTRDGRGRYGIMSQKMLADFRAEQLSPDNYVIRWSSPWVKRYEVTMDGADVLITYWYMDSIPMNYKGIERLSFGEENGRLVVTACKTELDMVECSQPTTWKQINAGDFSFSIPQEWQADLEELDGVHLSQNGREVGLLETLGYDPSAAISQFQGNHAETVMTESLSGCHYPATIVHIRRTQPAAANDDSYTDELHIYLIPQNSSVAYDFYFYSSILTEDEIEMARSFVLNEDTAK